MISRRARPIVVAIVVLWVVSGPIGMAFNGCAMMGAMCEAPCGISSYIVAPPVVGIVPQSIAMLGPGANDRITAASPSPLDPPPKSSLLSA